jgi:hypothetical protein
MSTGKTNYGASVAQARLTASLVGLGLKEGHDFFLRQAEAGTCYTLLDLTWKDSITKELLLHCSNAHGRDWGVLVGAYDAECDDLRPMVEVSGGGFSYISGGKEIQEVVKAAYRANLAAGLNSEHDGAGDGDA